MRMKNIIIKTAKELLKADGLRFTVDDLSARLNISKKTIYRLFDSKEELAKEVYHGIYTDIYDKVLDISRHEHVSYMQAEQVFIYGMEGIYFNRESIYNRYSLAVDLKAYAEDLSQKIWELVLVILGKSDYAFLTDIVYLRDIVYGALERICTDKNSIGGCKEFFKLITGVNG